jgi:hypothetical protein
MSRINGFWVLALAIGLWLTACGPGGSATPVPTTVALGSKPTLVVTAPVEGALFGVGSTVSIKSTATDARGIVKIELWVDGVLYRVDITKEGESLPSVSITQTWPANDLGNHVLLLKSINRDGAASDPQTINISVVPQSVIGSPTPSTTRTPAAATSAPTDIPTVLTTPVPAATTVAACDSDAVFVSDVTVPDGTAVKPGDAINKVWRLRNAGTCAWGTGYQLAFVDGAQMGAVSPVAVAATASGAQADIAVNMTAPRTAGTYTGKWRMRSPAGALFGQSVSIVIKVVDLNPPTPTPTTTPGALAADFSATRTTIPYADCVTLKWDIDNAAAVKLDGQGVVGHDTRLICPQATKEYVLEVIPTGGGDSTIRSITVTVIDPLKAASAPIPLNTSVNLSNGVANGLGADFKWTTDQTFVPQAGASFVRIGIRAFTDVQQDECVNNTSYSNATLSAGQVSPGTVLCYKTTSGHAGKLRIAPNDPSIPATSLFIQWVTW